MLALSAAGPLLLLAAVVGLMLWRPRGTHEAWPAGAGAAVALLAGWAQPGDLASAVRDTYGVLLFLLAATLLSGLADRAGVFRWLASWTLTTARGRGWLLLVNLYLLGALITLFLSLDVTAVVLTPVVCALVLRLRLDPLPFILACAFVANTASLALPMSNLTNMLVYDLLRVSFADFVRYLALPNLVAMLINVGIFLVMFWRSLPSRLEVHAPEHRRLPAAPFFRWSLVVLAVTTVSMVLVGTAGLPFWPVALPASLLLAAVSLRRGWATLREAAQPVAWLLPPFVLGMDVVVTAVSRTLAPALAQVPGAAAQAPVPVVLVATAAGTALGANAVNNLPLSLAAIQLLRDIPAGLLAIHGHTPLRPVLAFGTLLGVNLGPNLMVTGSLATMLVLGTARRQGIVITPWQYLQVGLVAAPAMLLAATGVLALLLH